MNNIIYKNFELKYLDDLHKLSISNNDILKPNTKMVYFIIGNYFSDTSFIALDNNKIVGFLVSFKRETKIWLHQIAVDKNFRKKGIASKLLNMLEEKLVDATIEFSVKENNSNAIRLYESIGYKKIKYNEQIDQIIYSKKI